MPLMKFTTTVLRPLKRAGTVVLAVAALAGLATVAHAAVAEEGGLTVSVTGEVSPYRLPRAGTVPISIRVAGHVSSTDGALPPQVTSLAVKVNRHGLLQSKGLPTCTVSMIQPGTSERAEKICGDAEVGYGQFWAYVVLPGQAPYPTEGRILLFNGREHGRAVLLAHIYTANPFFSSFVITFSMRHISQGTYGTELQATLPSALGSWGYVNRIKMTLSRNYTYHGRHLGYFNAGCPALKGFTSATFPMARMRFNFPGGRQLSTTLMKTCGVR
jgi:hypothetical protein